jgi:tetratricopeptide (TPR) repeat protein
MLGALGGMLASQGERVEAERLFDEAIAIVRDSDVVSMDQAALNNLGFLAMSLGRTTEAADLLSRALAVARQAGNAVSEVLTRCNLGFLYEGLGDFATAQQHFATALEIGRAFAIPDYIGVPLNGLGQVALKGGDLEAATADFTEAQALFEQSGMENNVLQVRGNLALVTGLQARRRGDGEAARQAVEEALSLFEQAGGTANATDQRPYARQLLAELGVQPGANSPSAAVE